MQAEAPTRAQFEEAIVTGAVFSPVLLTALPFATPTWSQIVIAAFLVGLLALTLVGHLAYRKQAHVSCSFRRWRTTLLVLLAGALLSVAVFLTFESGGPLAGAGALALFLLLAALAWKKLPRNRSLGEGNPGVAGVAGAFGAASSGALTVALGSGVVYALVVALHFALALIAAALLIRAAHEKPAAVHNGA